MSKFSHFDEQGNASMVDISAKAPTVRTAVARGSIRCNARTIEMIRDKEISKGDVFQIARIAGIMASKKTCELIPLCHQIALTEIKIDFQTTGVDSIEIETTATANDKTGVEMEALTATSVAALTVYDMCKSVDKAMVIEQIALLRKTGGKSGVFERKDS